LAPRAGLPGPSSANGLDCQTTVTAHTDDKSVSRALTNRQSQSRHRASGSKAPAVPQRAPSETEKRAIAEASKQTNQRPLRVKVSIARKGKYYQATAPHADAVGWENRLMNALGTSSYEFLNAELVRLLNLFLDREGRIDLQAGNAALAVIDGIKPQNEIEAMLAAQIAVTHALTMKFSARLYRGNIETIAQQDSAALTLSRLHRAFTTQLETLSNMRRGGQQKVVVEHVHVYPGGQAIVGNVSHTGRGIQNKNEGQAHAPDDQRTIAFARSAPMRSPDSAREALPIPNCERQEALSDARRSAGLGSTEGGAQRKLPARLLHRRGNRRTPGNEGSHS
jgi:hypothetical protein